MSQYVGKLISLVDTKNVRYGGVLASVSAETSSLVLSDVIVHGTESRVTGPGAVAPEREPRPSMEFKGTDVTDLQVLESEPAPKASTSEAHQTTNEQPSNDVNDAGAAQRGRADDDDFYTRTQRLAASHEEGEVQATKAYEKSSSFFDNLGGPSGTRGKEFRDKDRSLNLETFGETGYSGRGRGGRTRGRGQGRGRGRRGGHRDGRPRHDDQSARETEPRYAEHSRGESGHTGEHPRDHTSDHARDHTRGNRPRGGARSRGGDRTRGGERSRGGHKGSTVTEFVPGGQFA